MIRMADLSGGNRDLTAALLSALRVGCPVAPEPDGQGNRSGGASGAEDHAHAVAAAHGAPVAQRFKAAADPIEAAERAAIMAKPSLPPPGSPARLRMDRQQREIVGGLLAVARFHLTKRSHRVRKQAAGYL